MEPRPVTGGITNTNFLVEDSGKKFLVRVGEDIPVHQVMRFNELAASRAAYLAGISPAVIHQQAGILVLDYIECDTLCSTDVRKPENFERIIGLLKTCHHEIPKHLRGPVLTFWVFHVVRDYIWTLREGRSVYLNLLEDLQNKSQIYEEVIGPIELVFGHNDLLPANFLNDGKRIWLIDWDYAGFNSPLFDLGGLASNNEFTEKQELAMLETYFEKSVEAKLMHSYQAMKCASLLRETLWSMVSEIHSELDFNYAQYTADNLKSFENAHSNFVQT